MFFCSILVLAVVEPSNTSKLLDQIFNVHYDVTMKPTDNLTVVTVTPNTFILLAMDQQAETIQFSQEFLLKWFDPLLHWNPQDVDYERDWVKVPATKVWLPDIIFTNAIEMSELLSEDQQMVDLHYDGQMRTSRPAVNKSPCPLQIADFPYDVQHCNVTIGPWNFDRDAIQVQSSTLLVLPEKNRFEGNSEWELIDIREFRSDNYDVIMKVWFSEITYTVTLKRKPVYYVLVIQAPTFILSALTVFGLFTPNSSEDERRTKVEMSLNMFAAISMMLQLVSDMMPKASRLPLLGNYIVAQVFVVTAATIASILVHTIHHHVYTRAIAPPKWLRNLILFECCGKNKRRVAESRAETARSQDITQISAELRVFEPVREALLQTAIFVRDTIAKMSRIQENQHIWMRILDRCDLLLLVAFQVANIIVTAIYWK
ncbi:unnamed protein product [Caenorhabditis angaria]|uniref:Neurotransmitter-gated ion-channel ligand-binding domain-containing protein n=1 Tax=Caenorhabditis angaria TaxID=860376 RepID=A0A9P1IK39_9PELO|nr:unnamed protein product [Caenorhabditis angaria]